MNKKMAGAYACAKRIAEKVEDKKISVNKIVSCRQKLTSAIDFKDYDRCCQILLQFSNYVEMPFDFFYDLIEDCEKNKDILFTFINALPVKKESKKQEG